MLRCDFCAVAYTGYPSLSAHGLIYCIGLCYLGAYVIERDEYILSLKSDGELRKVEAGPLARVSSIIECFDTVGSGDRNGTPTIITLRPLSPNVLFQTDVGSRAREDRLSPARVVVWY